MSLKYIDSFYLIRGTVDSFRNNDKSLLLTNKSMINKSEKSGGKDKNIDNKSPKGIITRTSCLTTKRTQKDRHQEKLREPSNSISGAQLGRQEFGERSQHHSLLFPSRL